VKGEGNVIELPQHFPLEMEDSRAKQVFEDQALNGKMPLKSESR